MTQTPSARYCRCRRRCWLRKLAWSSSSSCGVRQPARLRPRACSKWLHSQNPGTTCTGLGARAAAAYTQVLEFVRRAFGAVLSPPRAACRHASRPHLRPCSRGQQRGVVPRAGGGLWAPRRRRRSCSVGSRKAGAVESDAVQACSVAGRPAAFAFRGGDGSPAAAAAAELCGVGLPRGQRAPLARPRAGCRASARRGRRAVQGVVPLHVRPQLAAAHGGDRAVVVRAVLAGLPQLPGLAGAFAGLAPPVRVHLLGSSEVRAFARFSRARHV